MTDVVVTGAHGFLGRHLARALADAGARVHGLGHGRWSEAERRPWGLASWSEADVEPEALSALPASATAVFHCAGSGSVAASVIDPERDRARTVSTTAAVLAWAARCEARPAVVFPSSVAVYGVAERLPIDEAHPRRPASPYGRHKAEAEDQLLRAAGQGTPVAIVRLFSIYGPGLRKQLLWDACGRILRGEHGFAGTGEETRDWLHVSDAVALLRLAAERASTACPIVNGGTGVSACTREVLEELFRALRRPGRPTFNGAPRAGDPPHHRADIGRARAWAWSPRIDWRAGLREYAAWFEGESPK